MKVSKPYRRMWAGVMLAAAVLLLVTCSTRETGDPMGVNNFSAAELTSLYNANGLHKTTFYNMETIYVTIKGLIPLEETHIEVVVGCPVCRETIKRVVVVTDREGKIENLPVWQHVGYDAEGNKVNHAGTYCLHITQPPKHDPWTFISECFDIVDEVSPDPQVHAVDGAGNFKGQAALVGEDIYAAGYHVAADTVRLYVVNDKWGWHEGDMLNDVSGGFEVVTPAGNGQIAPTLVWPAASMTGSYDLIVDTRPFGVFNVGDVVSDPLVAGLVVQNPAGAGDIIVDIACDDLGDHVNTFSDLDPLFAKVEPTVRSGDLLTWMANYTHWVPVYVMPHRPVWNTGDQLVTVPTSGTMQMPAYVQINPRSGAVTLFRLRGENKPGYYHPLRLWPGEWDVIVDVNRNRKYDAGIDLLDGGPRPGFTVTASTPVTIPAVRLIHSADEDVIERGRDWTIVWAYFIRPDYTPIAGVKVKFFIVRGPGKVEPVEAITDDFGMAWTKVSGMVYGQHTVSRAEAVVDGELHYATISHFRTPPCTHDQGHLQGFVAGP